MDRGAWWTTVRGVSESDTTERRNTHACMMVNIAWVTPFWGCICWKPCSLKVSQSLTEGAAGLAVGSPYTRHWPSARWFHRASWPPLASRLPRLQRELMLEESLDRPSWLSPHNLGCAQVCLCICLSTCLSVCLLGFLDLCACIT